MLLRQPWMKAERVSAIIGQPKKGTAVQNVCRNRAALPALICPTGFRKGVIRQRVSLEEANLKALPGLVFRRSRPEGRTRVGIRGKIQSSINVGAEQHTWCLCAVVWSEVKTKFVVRLGGRIFPIFGAILSTGPGSEAITVQPCDTVNGFYTGAIKKAEFAVASCRTGGTRRACGAGFGVRSATAAAVDGKGQRSEENERTHGPAFYTNPRGDASAAWGLCP